MDCLEEVPITIAPNPKRVRVVFSRCVIAETDRALTLQEAGWPDVQYIPREDVHTFLLERTALGTYCPRKGDAAYYTVRAGGRAASNAVWSYENPYPAAELIRAYFAFHREHVDVIEEWQ